MSDFDRMMDQVMTDMGHYDTNMRRDRPYNGQAHTDTGIRGSQEVKGLTMRDIYDAYIRAYCLSAGGIDPANMPYYREAEKGEHAALCSDDLFKLKGEVDPLAVAQNLGCELEKLMGIYPNIPKFSED